MLHEKVDKGGSFHGTISLKNRSWTIISYGSRIIGFRIKLKPK